MNLIFKCREDNDLYSLLKNLAADCERYDDLSETVEKAAQGAGVLLLADEYPCPGKAIEKGLLEKAKRKNLRLYIEYPAKLVGVEPGEPQVAQGERLVVTSGFFAPELDEPAILVQHGCWFMPVEAASAHLCIARVAGYRKAVFGVPDDAYPILFKHPGYDALVATSKLSQFITGRYAPSGDWKAVWERVLRWLCRSDDVPELNWKPAVYPQAGKDEKLPENTERDAFRRSIKWFRDNVVYSYYYMGDYKGAIEGYDSAIDHNGRQMQRTWPRADCIAETAMTFAFDWALNGNPESRCLAGQILDYVYSSPDFLQDDPESPAYGLVNWSYRNPVFYTDDNARVLLSSLAVRRLLGEKRWDEHILRCLLANLRTAGKLGFRRDRVDVATFCWASGVTALKKNHSSQSDPLKDTQSWRVLQEEQTVSYSPHHQAYLWAANLRVYALTGYEGFFTKTKNAIRMTMEVFPRWTWMNGITQEYARMLLPLAMLVRIEDKAEHRAWLTKVSETLLEQMQAGGAIREQTGDPASGVFPQPKTNDKYGTTEAPLIQEKGDPCCDLLYTANYAFIGLHEAAIATGDEKLREAENRLAEFMCRIQARSRAQAYLDGAWIRAFDYDLWEYFGSSADNGWGAWCVESGWTNSWIASVLALRFLDRTLFDSSADKDLTERLPCLLKEMGLA